MTRIRLCPAQALSGPKTTVLSDSVFTAALAAGEGVATKEDDMTAETTMRPIARLDMNELEQLAERILVGLAAGDAGGDATPDSLAAFAFLEALAFLRVRAAVRRYDHDDLEEMLYRLRNDALLRSI